MKSQLLLSLLACVALVVQGCATYSRQGVDSARAAEIESSIVRRQFAPSPETAKAILALDPENVAEWDVRTLLAPLPAPRIINIHGGIYPVHRRMISFSEFLIGMGYPGESIANPGDGTYTFSCYESSAKIAGVIAWYYEREGLRPIIVGHSQGGMQTVKVLRKLAGLSGSKLHVWDPLTWKREKSCEIVDPLTGQRRPVVGLEVAYATVTGAGGLTRVLPNQWDMFLTLHKIPDSADEFTGFCKQKDLLGGDFLGYGSVNEYKSMGRAVVRSVWLPTEYKHGAVPDTKHLLDNLQMMDWINQYRPSTESVDRPKLDTSFDGDTRHILWAAEVWFEIKKHWVIELQRCIRARHPLETKHG